MRHSLILLLLVHSLGWAAPGWQERRVPLQGVVNARQLGGILVPGGRVRDGWVYRSNSLYALSDLDKVRLRQLGIRSLIDFRLDWDRKKHPDRPDFLTELQHYYWVPMTLTTSPTGYRKMPDEYPRQIQEFFHILAEADNYPLIYHCAEGKDRTGITSALLLELLGADRPTILADYMASRAAGPRFQVDESWMQGVFEAVDEAGGIDSYLEQHGVPRQELESIRRLLITRD
ncbi:tyrosine-protein phosphatase [bacterium]|nr:tyrosine-protein phosphatase [bacterium]